MALPPRLAAAMTAEDQQHTALGVLVNGLVDQVVDAAVVHKEASLDSKIGTVLVDGRIYTINVTITVIATDTVTH